jgi:hypothetical protein
MSQEDFNLQPPAPNFRRIGKIKANEIREKREEARSLAILKLRLGHLILKSKDSILKKIDLEKLTHTDAILFERFQVGKLLLTEVNQQLKFLQGLRKEPEVASSVNLLKYMQKVLEARQRGEQLDLDFDTIH